MGRAIIWTRHLSLAVYSSEAGVGIEVEALTGYLLPTLGSLHF